MTMYPLYCNHGVPEQDSDIRKRFRGANTGLWFERFYGGYDPHGLMESNGSTKFKRSFLQQVRNAIYDRGKARSALQAVLGRHASMAVGLQAETLAARTSGYFVSGTGNPHPVENGFCWHPTLGLPYLPGSAVKGMTRAWLELNGYQKEAIEVLFGTDPGEEPSLAGAIQFFDALPVDAPDLVVDVMTPHMGKYYERGGEQPGHRDTLPADWHSPIPVPFLVADDLILVFLLAARRPEHREMVGIARQALEAALLNIGAGAKTAAGYGQFVLDTKAARAWAPYLNTAKEAGEIRIRQQGLARMSPQEQIIEGLRSDFELPANHAREGTFHGKLLETLETALQWTDQQVKNQLADLAQPFITKHFSKGKGKDGKRLLRRLRGEE